MAGGGRNRPGSAGGSPAHGQSPGPCTVQARKYGTPVSGQPRQLASRNWRFGPQGTQGRARRHTGEQAAHRAAQAGGQHAAARRTQEASTQQQAGRRRQQAAGRTQEASTQQHARRTACPGGRFRPGRSRTAPRRAGRHTAAGMAPLINVGCNCKPPKASPSSSLSRSCMPQLYAPAVCPSCKPPHTFVSAFGRPTPPHRLQL